MKPATLVALVLALGACKSNPVEDKPMAKVEAVSTRAVQLSAVAQHAAPTALAVEAVSELLSIDPSNSKVGFVGAKVTGKHDGSFSGFGGTLQFQKTLERSKLSLEVDVATLKTDGGDKLDGHLKSGDFFDVQKFPKASFTSDSISKNADGSYTVAGAMDIHGVTKSISFPATATITPELVTLKSEFGIKRKDFGVVYPGKPNDLIKEEILLRVEMNLPRKK